jgi:ABC-2 type transport system permease protein
MGGIVFPREAMPGSINALAMLVPTTPGIFGFVKLNQMGASWSEIRPEFLNMTALLLLNSAAAWWAVRARRREPKEYQRQDFDAAGTPNLPLPLSKERHDPAE